MPLAQIISLLLIGFQGPGLILPAPAQAPAPPRQIVISGVPLKLDTLVEMSGSEILAQIGDHLPLLGATLEHQEDTGLVRITAQRQQTLELTVNSTELRSGDQVTVMPAAPVIRDGKLLLPVLSLVSALGAHARTDSEGILRITPLLRDVHLETAEADTSVQITASAPVRFRTGELNEPDRFYIDIEPAVLSMTPGEFYVATGGGAIVRGRVGQFSLNPDVCRVVFDLAGPTPHNVIAPLITDDFTVWIGPTAAARQPPSAAPTVTPAASISFNRVEHNLRGVTIVVDAGHGGHDQGTTGITATLEKHVNLDLALRLAERLKQLGAKVILTRDADYYVTLSGRCAIANRSGAHMFVSVHVNAWPKPNGRSGTEIFYTHPPSLPLAQAVHDRMIELLGRRDGGVRRRGLYVTNHTIMPSILTETAYLNHAEEEKLLNTPEFRQRAADAMALGVVQYAHTYLKAVLRPPQMTRATRPTWKAAL